MTPRTLSEIRDRVQARGDSKRHAGMPEQIDAELLLAEVERLRADLCLQHTEFLVVRTERDAAQTSVDELRTELTRVRAQRDESRGEVDALRSLVDDLLDGNPCSFDHHGYCQEHGWFETDPPCPDGRAQKLLGDPS